MYQWSKFILCESGGYLHQLTATWPTHLSYNRHHLLNIFTASGSILGFCSNLWGFREWHQCVPSKWCQGSHISPHIKFFSNWPHTPSITIDIWYVACCGCYIFPILLAHKTVQTHTHTHAHTHTHTPHTHTQPRYMQVQWHSSWFVPPMVCLSPAVICTIC